MASAFSDEWAREWCRALNASERYREAAASWDGSVAVVAVESGGEGRRAVFLDLARGSCKAARAATPEDLALAEYLFEGPTQAWRELLTGVGSPLSALLTGRIRLTRGALASLLPHVGAARELMAIAETIAADFPAGW